MTESIEDKMRLVLQALAQNRDANGDSWEGKPPSKPLPVTLPGSEFADLDGEFEVVNPTAGTEPNLLDDMKVCVEGLRSADLAVPVGATAAPANLQDLSAEELMARLDAL